jgi:hypothetical protein
MPTIQLDPGNWGTPFPVVAPRGGTISVFRPQFRCLLRVPNAFFPRDAIIDTGAPLTCFPEAIWSQFREGIDFEWLPFAPGVHVTPGRVAGWQFTFQMARFLVSLALMDYTTAVERPEVIAQFAAGNPSATPSRRALPPIVVGLWGGLLEGGKIAIERTPTGQVSGTVEFP